MPDTTILNADDRSAIYTLQGLYGSEFETLKPAQLTGAAKSPCPSHVRCMAMNRVQVRLFWDRQHREIGGPGNAVSVEEARLKKECTTFAVAAFCLEIFTISR